MIARWFWREWRSPSLLIARRQQRIVSDEDQGGAVFAIKREQQIGNFIPGLAIEASAPGGWPAAGGSMIARWFWREWRSPSLLIVWLACVRSPAINSRLCWLRPFSIRSLIDPRASTQATARSLLIVWLALSLAVACVLALGSISDRMEKGLSQQSREFCGVSPAKVMVAKLSCSLTLSPDWRACAIHSAGTR
jgi:predicted lysophospholipase L1 biosynthesis ABC-type transport system permease subunit